jgi:hypothetical protein
VEVNPEAFLTSAVVFGNPYFLPLSESFSGYPILLSNTFCTFSDIKMGGA